LQQIFLEARDTLRQWREECARRPEEVVEIWELVLKKCPNFLEDELWIVYEQVIIAALDSNRSDVALDCLSVLHKKFPFSNRVLKLEAMHLEFLEDFDGASEIYDQLSSKDPTNMFYRKRKLAILKAQGKRAELIKELTEYLKVFINDNEAWLELSNLYLQERDYAHAAYCMEELVLSNPHNSLYSRRLAEIKYAQGGQGNYEVAKTYFEHALKINTKCMRSLYGLMQVTNLLAETSSGQKQKEYVQTGTQAANRILDILKKVSGEKSSLSYEIKAVENVKQQFESF
uniref:ER membrane protein complex subunit 2 n=1 Tax=Syphacia muris TaxID=451379 RepID=A0A0N5AJI9_9BILA